MFKIMKNLDFKINLFGGLIEAGLYSSRSINGSFIYITLEIKFNYGQ